MTNYHLCTEVWLWSTQWLAFWGKKKERVGEEGHAFSGCSNYISVNINKVYERQVSANRVEWRKRECWQCDEMAHKNNEVHTFQSTSQRTAQILSDIFWKTSGAPFHAALQTQSFFSLCFILQASSFFLQRKRGTYASTIHYLKNLQILEAFETFKWQGEIINWSVQKFCKAMEKQCLTSGLTTWFDNLAL